VNNAGIAGILEFTHKYPDDLYEKIMRVNVDGVWFCMKEALKIMLEQGEVGSIVNISSVAGIGAAPRMSAYAASKHAVIGLTRTAAHEYGKYKIRVNAICPTIIETPMGLGYANEEEGIIQMIKHSIPLKRFGQAEEVAESIAWLCSKESSFVTGMELRVDGGMKA
ncbi:MAG: SDR family oxidoreductase, partial [Bacteroidota bacterium]